MGYNTSFRFLGNIIGPMFGGIISGYIGIAAVFTVTGSLFILAFFLLIFALRRNTVSFEDYLEKESAKS